MTRFNITLRAASILVATMIGAGVFALPYATTQSGWMVGAGYLLGLGLVLYAAHLLYAEALDKVGERSRLLGLVHRYGGEDFFFIALIAIVGGLVLSLFAYLLITQRFLQVFFPFFEGPYALLLTWSILSLPIFFRIARFTTFELLGSLGMVAIILFLFFSAVDIGNLSSFSPVVWDKFFFSFGPFLFALAGWTAVEPMYEYVRSRGGAFSVLRRAFVIGTAATILLYAMFILGILGNGTAPSSDTISGAFSYGALLAVLGVLAVWTSYVPVARELDRILKDDLRTSHVVSLGVPLLLPFFLAILGIGSFFGTISFVGSVLIALQYLFILFVAYKVLPKRERPTILLIVLGAIFFLGILYELTGFIIPVS